MRKLLIVGLLSLVAMLSYGRPVCTNQTLTAGTDITDMDAAGFVWTCYNPKSVTVKVTGNLLIRY